MRDYIIRKCYGRYVVQTSPRVQSKSERQHRAMKSNSSALVRERSFAVICSLLSGLYRRPRNYTGSADPSGQSQMALAGFMLTHIYRRWGVTPRPENVSPARTGFVHVGCSKRYCKNYILNAASILN